MGRDAARPDESRSWRGRHVASTMRLLETKFQSRSWSSNVSKSVGSEMDFVNELARMLNFYELAP